MYPGADFSRFAHSIGVLHVTGLFLAALERTRGRRLAPKVFRACRAAALVHDLGHYPFSHSWEQVAENHYKNQVLEGPGKSTAKTKPKIRELFWKHERVGKELLLRDRQLRDILARAKLDADELASYFNRDEPGPLANLVSSDLDADRVDYLLRTTLHTGLPYGSIDLPYLVTQLRLDKQGRVCLDPRALRTADHLILCRFFDRQQVAYHKTAVGFELLLQDVLGLLLRLKDSPVATSPGDVLRRIGDDTWKTFTDSYVLTQIEELAEGSDDELTALKCESLLRRRPPKLIAEMERFASRGPEERRRFRLEVRASKRELPQLEADLDIKGRLFLWDPQPMPLTKVGAVVPIAPDVAADDDEQADAYEQSIRIMDRRTRDSKPITGCGNSLLHVLGDQSFYALRIYGVFDQADSEARRLEAYRRIKKLLPDIAWT